MLRLLALILFMIFLAATSGLVYADETPMLAEINEFRAENGLPPVKSNPQTCEFAATRAEEISANFSHEGFYERVKTKSLPYPKYKRVTENLAKTKHKDAVKLWIKSPSHAANMLKQTSLVCIRKHGNFYAYEGLEI